MESQKFLETSKELTLFEIPKTYYLTMTHFGSIETKDDTWRLLLGFVKHHNIEYLPTYTYEAYPVNETSTLDSSLWETEIYLPLKDKIDTK